MSFSTFTAISELFVTAGVLYLVVTNYRGKPFRWRLAVGLLVFEFCVNMLYMIYRMQQIHPTSQPGDPKVALAALHGSLSLCVFVMLAVYAFLAQSDSRRGRYFFREHKIQTAVFIVLWLLSVASGEVLFFLSFSKGAAPVV
jgi:hypothetical protein